MSSSRPGLGVFLFLLMTVFVSTMDTSVKYIGAFVPVAAVVWARYLVQFVLIGGWLVVRPQIGFATAHPRFQIVRGVLLVVSSTMAMTGLQYMPIAEFTAIGMLVPVLTTLLAAWLLREQVSRLRWALVFGCFAGAVVVIRPGSGLFGWSALLPLSAACCYAAFQIVTSRLTGLDHPYTTQFYSASIGLALATLMLPVFEIDLLALLPAVSAAHWVVLLLVGVCSTVAHVLLISAIGLAPNSMLMPFMYVQLGWAALSGWLVFERVPDGWAWLGMLIIGVCGAAAAWLNAQEAQRRHRTPPLPSAEVTA